MVSERGLQTTTWGVKLREVIQTSRMESCPLPRVLRGRERNAYRVAYAATQLSEQAIGC
jgi:hypothetical protein